MAALSKVLRALAGGRVAFYCPGCDGPHQVGVEPPAAVVWGWNRNAERPTFSPSILVRGVRRMSDEEHARYTATRELPEPVPVVCHSFVRDGRIEFLADSTHELAGQTVPIPDWPTSWGA